MPLIGIDNSLRAVRCEAFAPLSSVCLLHSLWRAACADPRRSPSSSRKASSIRLLTGHPTARPLPQRLWPMLLPRQRRWFMTRPIGSMPARGRTPAGLAAQIAAKLRNGYIREPSVAVEIEAYRPFFILGEVAAPGQYPYVPNMSVESAVAIAGGFSPRARRDRVTLTHIDNSGTSRTVVPLGTALGPGDTVLVGERWF